MIWWIFIRNEGNIVQFLASVHDALGRDFKGTVAFVKKLLCVTDSF